MKRIILYIILFIVVAGLIIIAIKGCPSKRGDALGNTATVEKGDVAKTVVATGKIEPLYKAEVKSKIGGLVKQFFVEEGDVVRLGQKLVEVIPGTTPVEMVTARSEVKVAAYQKDVAEKRYIRQQDLLKKNLISPDEFDKASVDFFAAKARFYAAMAQLRVLEQGSNVSAFTDEIELNEQDRLEIEKETREALASMTIIAPIDGIVLSRDTDKGSAVIPMSSAFGGTVILTLADVSEKHFLGNVDEADIGKVHLGLTTRVYVESYPNDSFAAELTHISPMGREEEDIINFEIRATIQDPDNKLRVGMSADAEIVLEERKDVLVAPEGALRYEDDKIFVHVKDDSIESGFRRVEISKGISDGIRTQVESGLKEGDVVILPQ
ncbi:efflux RND transporter periplasmic adaptor subunit [candidate division KSB1 bacterium]|nr:efflux RND transporter periplasmic adaptor subunit [candidate division KSB1 bacterium]